MYSYSLLTSSQKKDFAKNSPGHISETKEWSIQDYAKKWKNLEDLQRLKYQNMAKIEKESYMIYKKSKIGRKDSKLAKPMKKPPNSYILFTRKLKNKNPEILKGLTLKQRNSLMAEKWKEADSKTKTELKEEELRLREEFINLKLGEIDSELENDPNSNLKIKKKVHQPFLIYSKLKMPEFKKSNPNLKYVDCLKGLSSQWKELNNAQKSEYINK